MAYQALLPAADRAAPPPSRRPCAPRGRRSPPWCLDLLFLCPFSSLSRPFFPSPSVFFPFFEENSHRGRRCLGNAVCLQNLGLKPLALRNHCAFAENGPDSFRRIFTDLIQRNLDFRTGAPATYCCEVFPNAISLLEFLVDTFRIGKKHKSKFPVFPVPMVRIIGVT